MLRRFHADRAVLGRGNLSHIARIVVMPSREETTMRWKISHHGHDPRQIDLLAIVVLVILIISAFSYFEDRASPPAHSTGFIEPSQSVRW
jgi:hypothetical protein